MNKLSREILDSCSLDNCCMNELVILPPEGDVGFDEYFLHKAEMVRKAKKIFSPIEQNMLMLEYPKPDSRIPYIFERFFDSPVIVARNHEFEGCFAVDISEYIAKTNDEHFEQLMSYVRTQKNTVFTFILYSNNTNEIQNMYEYLSRIDTIRQVNIPLPTAKTLTDYTSRKIQEFSLHIAERASSFLTKFYTDRSLGFDFADYLVRCLHENGYMGDYKLMKETVEKADAVWCSNGSAIDFGY